VDSSTLADSTNPPPDHGEVPTSPPGRMHGQHVGAGGEPERAPPNLVTANGLTTWRCSRFYCRGFQESKTSPTVRRKWCSVDRLGAAICR